MNSLKKCIKITTKGEVEWDEVLHIDFVLLKTFSQMIKVKNQGFPSVWERWIYEYGSHRIAA